MHLKSSATKTVLSIPLLIFVYGPDDQIFGTKPEADIDDIPDLKVNETTVVEPVVA